MEFRHIALTKYHVLRSKEDKRSCGIVEKQEYASIDMETGERTIKRFWIANCSVAGKKATAPARFDTRAEAGKFLMKDASIKYNDRKARFIEKA